jgi:hypothetical protein
MKPAPGELSPHAASQHRAQHFQTVSELKTSEQILGLGSLTYFDGPAPSLLANFQTDPGRYEALNRHRWGETTISEALGAKASTQWDFCDPMVPELELNRGIWQPARGPDSPTPTRVTQGMWSPSFTGEIAAGTGRTGGPSNTAANPRCLSKHLRIITPEESHSMTCSRFLEHCSNLYSQALGPEIPCPCPRMLVSDQRAAFCLRDSALSECKQVAVEAIHMSYWEPMGCALIHLSWPPGIRLAVFRPVRSAGAEVSLSP